MTQKPNSGCSTVSFEELAYSNMLIIQALVEILTEKGLVGTKELTERVKRLRHESAVSPPKPPEPERTGASDDPMATPVVVTAGDLVSANMVIVESLLALLVDKALLTQSELEQLIAELKQKSGHAISRPRSAN